MLFNKKYTKNAKNTITTLVIGKTDMDKTLSTSVLVKTNVEKTFST